MNDAIADIKRLSGLVESQTINEANVNSIDDGRYQIILTGAQIDGTPVYINPTA